MTQYYKIMQGHELWHPDGHLLGNGGDVIALETDSEDKKTRKAALGVLKGNWSIVALTAKPEKKTAKKASKKATYSTKDATPEG